MRDSVRFTSTAENDLLEAWLYLAEDNVSAADKMLDRINDEVEKLAIQPLMGRERGDLASELRS